MSSKKESKKPMANKAKYAISALEREQQYVENDKRPAWLRSMQEHEAEYLTEVLNEIAKGRYDAVPSSKVAEILSEVFTIPASNATIRKFVSKLRQNRNLLADLNLLSANNVEKQ